MQKISTILFAIIIAGLQTACNSGNNSFDASGSFEAEETIISAEATGVIKELNIEEGQKLRAEEAVGYIDSVQLHLKKQQLEAQVRAMLGKQPDIPVQLSVLQEQLRTADRERTRLANLVKGGAATQKQLDDINAQITLLHKQIDAQKSTLNISSEGLAKDAVPLKLQIAQLNDQLAKCVLINPLEGTVLARYAEPHEMTSVGKPLYKIADLSAIILKAYISGDQLPEVKLNQQVKVLTDDGRGGFKETSGIITWISDKAEFTPKTIRTKNERANLVYAIKVKVKNDGSYKIGMYGELKFQ